MGGTALGITLQCDPLGIFTTGEVCHSCFGTTGPGWGRNPGRLLLSSCRPLGLACLLSQHLKGLPLLRSHIQRFGPSCSFYVKFLGSMYSVIYLVNAFSLLISVFWIRTLTGWTGSLSTPIVPPSLLWHLNHTVLRKRVKIPRPDQGSPSPPKPGHPLETKWSAMTLFI